MPHGQRQPRDAKVAVKQVEYRGTANKAGRVLQRVKANYRWAVPHLRIDTAPILELVSSEILRSSTSGGQRKGPPWNRTAASASAGLRLLSPCTASRLKTARIHSGFGECVRLAHMKYHPEAVASECTKLWFWPDQTNPLHSK